MSVSSSRVRELYATGGIREVCHGIARFFQARANRLPFLIRSWWPGPVSTTLAGTRCRWYIDTRKDWERARHANGEEHALEMFLADVDEHSVLWDVGAHHGTYSIPAANKGARVIAFEPHTGHRERLEKHVIANGVQAQTTVNDFALGASDRQAGFAIDEDGEHHVTHAASGDEVIQIRKGDGLTAPSPTHLKVDVEGHEAAVLAGVKRLLSNEVQVILVELHSEEKTTIFERLEGFKIREISDGSRSQTFVLAKKVD